MKLNLKFLRFACLAVAVAGLHLSQPAWAQTPTAQVTQQYNIPAGPLAEALTRFAAQARISLSFDPSPLADLQSDALVGEFSVHEGLERLLAGSGFRYTNTAQGEYSLEPVTEGTTALPTVNVEATSSAFDPGSTDGSGSYAPSLVNSATGLELDALHTPHSMSVVTNQQIEDQNLTSMIDVLRQVPGVEVNHLDSERYDISVRGQSVNMMIDGSPAPGFFGGPSNEIQMINTATLDRVEVVRGATGLMNGSGGYGGSVNLVRKRPIKGEAVSGHFGMGSWDRYQAQIDVSTDLNETGSVRSRWLISSDEGNSFMQDYDRTERVYYGIVETDVGVNTTLSLGIERFVGDVDGNSFIHIPFFYDDGTMFEAPHSFNPAPPWASADLENTTVFADARHQFNDDWSLKVALSWFNSQADLVRASLATWNGPIEKSTGTISTFRSLLDQESDRYSLDTRLEGVFEAFGRQHDLLFGLNYHQEELGHYATSFFFDDGTASVNIYQWPNDLPPYPNPIDADSSYLQPNNTQTLAAYAAMNFKLLDPLSLILGTRWQQMEFDSSVTDLSTGTRSTDGWEDSGEFVPYAALIYDITRNITTYLSYSDVFNVQTEESRDGSRLPPERGVNYEFGIKGEFFDGQLQPSLSFYRQQVEDTAVEDPGFVFPDGESAYVTEDGVTRRGWDFTIAGEPIRGWTLQGGFGESDDDGTDEETRFFTLTTAWDATSRFAVGGNITAYPKRTVDIQYSNETYDLPSLTLVNLFASYRITPTLRVVMNVENVTDEFYIDSAGTYGSYTYGPDRHYMLTLRYEP